MRISWRELDWISERDRHEIERRMHVLGGHSGLLDRVDFSGRASSAAGAFEIRITANAAKRQIIAVRRDPQRVKAFNSAFAALERSVVSVLKSPPQPQPQPRAAAPSTKAEPAPRPALTEPESRLQSLLSRRRTRTALVVAAAVAGFGVLALWMPRGEREVDVGARASSDVTAFSAVAKIPVEARVEREPAFSAIARLSASER